MEQQGQEQEKKVSIFSKIESLEDALKMIKSCAIGFCVVAVIQGAIGLFIAPSLLIDALLYVVLTGVMYKWNSRIAAGLLFLLAGVAAYSTVLNRLGVAAEGGSNIVLAIIILWTAVRSVEATFKVNGQYAQIES